MASHDTTPLWMEINATHFERPVRSGRYDAVIVGGGIAGLTAALLMKQAGARVCLLERNQIGNGYTGCTTAHLSCVTDTRLSQLVSTFGREEAALVWYAGIAAIDNIEHLVHQNGIECGFKRVPGYLHAALERAGDESDTFKEEAALARELGFNASFVEHAPLVCRPGMRVEQQAKFHPLAYLQALAAAVDGGGSAVCEDVAVGAIEDDPLAVVAGEAHIECDYLVIATHVPLVGKTGFWKASLQHSKLAPYSSYVLSGKIPRGLAPEALLWDTSDPYYYLRIDRGVETDRVIFGGNDHKTGQASNTAECFDRLQVTLLRILPSVEIDHRWSGQVIETNDGLPYIGESSARQFVATGFSGNGMTFGTLAGMMACDAMLRKSNPWQELFSVDRTKIRGGAWDYLKENLDYPYYMLADRLAPPPSRDPRSLRPGTAKVLSLDGRRVACFCDERGELHQVSAECTHLGCLVQWNQAEQTWDCPCHGSRFRPTGEVVAGPAESPLEEVRPAASHRVS
jgi:glycine/D-amino acid oxidase-like deaminating enzyme/nitrite reductase/ring-hydroxylating ferredoxin subunit